MATSQGRLRIITPETKPQLNLTPVVIVPEDSHPTTTSTMETQPKINPNILNNNMLSSEATVALVARRLAQPDVDKDDDYSSSSEEERKIGASSICSFASSREYSSSSSSKMSQHHDHRDVRCQKGERSSEDIRLRDSTGTLTMPASSSSSSLPPSLESFRPSRQPLALFQHIRPTMTTMMEPEVDSLDAKPAREPLHIVGALEDLLPATTTRLLNKSVPTPVTPRKPRLTLSAFRKPEEAVRLTDCDASRLLENEYNLRAPGCRVIGHGAFSTVRLAIRYADGQKAAVKSISKFDALRARRLRRAGPSNSADSKHMDEWEIMRLLKNNPYVLALLDVFETEEEIHLVTDYCEGGELFDAIKRKGAKRSSFRRGRYSEAQAARITNQILHALLDLHDHGIVHRDIKPENILLVSNDDSDIQVKLADFGMARLHAASDHPSTASVDGESSPSTPGLAYTTNAPPEICGKGACGPAADIFSLGVTLYILLCGFSPVFCDGVVEFPEAYWGDISDEAKSVVRSMVHPDPCSRMSVRSALVSPWVRQQNTRVRRGSISANLELVRSRLYKTMGGDSATHSKKRRRGSLSTLSPKKQRRLSMQLNISMTDLFSVSEKGDVRVIEERIQSRPEMDERSSVQ